MAALAGCSRPTILSYIDDGKIMPDFRIGKNRVAFLPESVERVQKALAARRIESWRRFCAKYDAEQGAGPVIGEPKLLNVSNLGPSTLP
jgi:predicted DNA-binding transcriptional regulator AlpA